MYGSWLPHPTWRLSILRWESSTPGVYFKSSTRWGFTMEKFRKFVSTITIYLYTWNLFVLYFWASTLQKKALNNQNKGHIGVPDTWTNDLRIYSQSLDRIGFGCGMESHPEQKRFDIQNPWILIEPSPILSGMLRFEKEKGVWKVGPQEISFIFQPNCTPNNKVLESAPGCVWFKCVAFFLQKNHTTVN